MLEQYDPEKHGPLIDKLSAEQIDLKKNSLKSLSKLLKNKDYDKIIKEAESIIPKFPEKPAGAGDQDISAIFLIFATAVWESQNDAEKARKLAIKSLHFDRLNKGALWLIREVKNDISDESKYYMLEVVGKYFGPTKEGIDIMPFKTIYSVVARSEEHALELIREVERPEVSDTLEITSLKEGKKDGDVPDGVYTTMRLVVAQKSKNKSENDV